jgi:hypothetical protein
MGQFFLFVNAVMMPGYLVCLSIPFAAFMAFGIYRIITSAVERRKEKAGSIG